MFEEQPLRKPAASLLKRAAVICSSLILGAIVIGLSCARRDNPQQEAEPLPSTKRGLVSVPVQPTPDRLLPGTKSAAPFTTGHSDGLPGPIRAEGGAPVAQEPGDLLPSTKVRVFDSSRPIRQVLEELGASHALQLTTQPATQPTTRDAGEDS